MARTEVDRSLFSHSLERADEKATSNFSQAEVKSEREISTFASAASDVNQLRRF